MRGDGQLQDRGDQQPSAHHVELPQQLRQARVPSGSGWVSSKQPPGPQLLLLLFKKYFCFAWMMYFSLNPPAVMLNPGFGKSWHISPRLCQALSTLASPPWSDSRQKLEYLSPFAHFQELPTRGQTNSTTCITRNQPGSRESTRITISRASGIPLPSLSSMPRQPRGK